MPVDLTDPRQTLELLNALLPSPTDALTHPKEIPSPTAQASVSTPTDTVLTPLTPAPPPGGVRSVSGASVRLLTQENQLQDGGNPTSVSVSVAPRSGDLSQEGGPIGAGGGRPTPSDFVALHRECWTLVEQLRRLDWELAGRWGQILNRTPLEARPQQLQELQALLARLANGADGTALEGR